MTDKGPNLDVDAPDDQAVLEDGRSQLRDRDSAEPARVSFVELFYDLIFVFAMTQLAAYLADNLTGEGAVRSAVLFVAIWWLWINTTWTTNRLDPDSDPVRLAIFALMGGSLVLSMALPQAFGDRALVFVLPYVAMQIGRCLFSAWALTREGEAVETRVPQRQAAWFALSGTIWLAGAMAEADLRVILWVLALVVELSAPLIGYPVPGLGRETTRELDVEGEHLSERCGLFIILCLGETLLVTGARAATMEWTLPTLAALATAVVGSLALWWLYFDTGSKRGTRAFEEKSPGRLARVAYTYLHLPIVAGIVMLAVGDKALLDHPRDPASLPYAVMLLGGAAMFLGGNFLFKNATSRRWPVSHLAGIGVLAVGAVVAGHLDVIGLSVWAVVTLIAVAALERALIWSKRAALQGIK